MPDSTASFEELARSKLARVLGAERGRRVFEEILAEAKLERIASADDLHAFADRLVARGGIEAGVGGLLAVAAVVRGASASPT